MPWGRRVAILSCAQVTGEECFHVKIVSATDAERTAPGSGAFYRDALGDANLTIFESVYPPNKFMQTCGYEKLKECVENREIEVNEDIMTALGEIDAGNLRTGADLLAKHEQVDVVQPVYERHKETFEDLATAESWVPGDQTSIPVSYDCTRHDLVPLGDLDIAKPRDRVKYYGRLMDRMMTIEGLP